MQIGDDRDHMPPATVCGTTTSPTTAAAPAARGRMARRRASPRAPSTRTSRPASPTSPAAASAAMTLAGDLDTAQSLYKLAEAKPGNAMSVPVRAPYYYGESTYFDDLEWAAVELLPRHARRVSTSARRSRYAHQAGGNPWMGQDRHGHYEFFPYVNLAHWRLYPHCRRREVQAATGRLLPRRARDGSAQRAEKNPYRLGTPLVWCSTNDVIAFATQAVLYEQMTGDTTYRALAAEARDWIFGRNPWGVSFVIGVPDGGARRQPAAPLVLQAQEPPAGRRRWSTDRCTKTSTTA